MSDDLRSSLTWTSHKTQDTLNHLICDQWSNVEVKTVQQCQQQQTKRNTK